MASLPDTFRDDLPRASDRADLRETAMTLTDIWFVLFVVIIAGYLILDGFDMGVGILLAARWHGPTPSGGRSSTASARSGTATRSGWSSGAASCSRVFPLAYASLFSGLLPRVHARPARDDPAHGRASSSAAKEPRPRWRSTWDTVFAARLGRAGAAARASRSATS